MKRGEKKAARENGPVPVRHEALKLARRLAWEIAKEKSAKTKPKPKPLEIAP